MKKIFLWIFCILYLANLNAQTSGKLFGLRDAWGTSIDYVGEIKNKQPNGLGIAIYSNDNTLRYSGYFVNGLYNGKGVMLFKDGSFLSGDWKNGKLNGKGANLTSGGDLYVGDFIDSKKDGTGFYTFANGALVVGGFKNDTYSGRCIYIPATGNLIADNIYVEGKKNGGGYTYDLSSKTLTESSWNDGTQSTTGTADYTSFLKSSNFYGEKTDNQIIMGIIDRTNNNLLQDTGFFYNLNKGGKEFGYHEKGYLTNGIEIKDSSRFIGKLNDDGAIGYCSFYKTNNYYDEGIYDKDYLNGSNSLSIDLKKQTVYYGSASYGSFIGKGWYSNKYNELYSGEFDSSRFTGRGFITFANGKTIRGIFKNGVPQTITSFTDENGVAIQQKPKTFSDALSLITDEYSNDYQAFKLDYADEDEYSLDDYIDTYNSLISFPGATETDVILEDYDYYLTYNVRMYTGIDYQQASLKYNELCKALSTVALHLQYSNAPITLSGNTETPQESETTRSKFSLVNYTSLKDYNVYAELKYDDGIYKVNLVAGDVVFDK